MFHVMLDGKFACTRTFSSKAAALRAATALRYELRRNNEKWRGRVTVDEM